MLGEIRQIPAAVAQLLGAIGNETAPIAAAFRERDPAWVAIVARGSSDHAAVYARYLVETALGIPAALAAPSVTTAYRAPLRWTGGALLAISQSGESTDVVEVTEVARAAGALTVAVTNEAGSPLAAAAEHLVLCRAGAEVALPATKTYVAQLVAVASIVAAVARDTGLVRGLERLPDVLDATLAESAAWIAGQAGPDDIARVIAEAERAIVVSRGFNLATALEIGLKLKETSGVFAEAYSAADLLHGPLVLAGREVPMLVVRPDGPTAPSIDEAVGAAQRRGAATWVIASGGASGSRRLALAAGLQEPLTPVPFVIPGYLIAEAVARRRGLDPDAPAGLTKVTRTR